MGLANVIFSASRDNKLLRLKVFLDHRPKEEVKQLVSTRTHGTTPLAVACRNGHLEVVRYLLDVCHASTELVVSVVFDGDTIEGAPPLWCAAAAGHHAIVRLLVERGADVNAVTSTHSSPLRAACFDGHFSIVKYLVERGADIEIANNHGHTCLMISCYKGHLDIARYLVSRGARVNRRSVKGNTALHDCAESGRLDMLQYLLQAGAVMECDSSGISPLLAAAMCGHTEVVEYLLTRSDLTSPLQMINALELLGATCVDKKSDLTAATNYWKRALDKRFENSSRPLPKPEVLVECPQYDNTCEARSHRDLEQLTSDPDEMRMQALMIRERILGPAHPETSYYIRYRGAVYADTGNFGRCIQLWMYALGMQQSQLEALSPLTQSSLMSFAELFSFMMADQRASDSQEPPILHTDHMLEVFSRSVDEVIRGCTLVDFPSPDRYHLSLGRSLSICIHLLSLLVRVQRAPLCSRVHRLLYRLQKHLRHTDTGLSALHALCSQNVSAGRVFMRARAPLLDSVLPCVETVRLLLLTGADANATDNLGSTPLHVLVAGVGGEGVGADAVAACVTVARCLIDAGAHVDTVNEAGMTPLDLLKGATQPVTCCAAVQQLRLQLQSPRHVSLQCLSARVLSSMSRQYVQSMVPPHLLDLVNSH